MDGACTPIYLHESHPFVKEFDVAVGEAPGGNGYRAVWRDFLSVKQDRYFDALDEAKVFAAELKKSCHIIDTSYYLSVGYSYEELTSFWDI